VSAQAEGGRRWLVTGASRGLGLAIARRAIAGGDKVCLLARSPDIAAIAAGLGPNAIGLTADVTDLDNLASVCNQAAEALGGIDVLVNNAGLHRGGKVATLAVEDWDAVLATNLSGPLHVIRAALGHMGQGGAIVNIGAVVGFRGFAGDACYGAAKSGLAGLTKVLAVELAPKGIRVNQVIPGFVGTEMTAGLSDRARDAIVAKVPLGRMGLPEEIADVCWWVAGSSYMTGSDIMTDGGLMCGL
jgi:3-oxoacyl-[acyl-carrier protein] reductase